MAVLRLHGAESTLWRCCGSTGTAGEAQARAGRVAGGRSRFPHRSFHRPPEALDQKRAQDAFLTLGNAGLARRHCVSGMAQRDDGGVSARQDVYSISGWRPRTRPHLRLIKVVSLIVISLLSLALWVAISEAVISLAVAVLS